MAVTRRQLLAAGGSALWLPGCGGGSGGADDSAGRTESIEWAIASRGPSGRRLAHVCRGNGVTVAAGSNGIGSNRNVYHAISVRTDSGEWAAKRVAAMSEFSDISGVAFGKGRFVATTSRGEILTSKDGQSWTLVNDLNTVRLYVELYRCAFGNDTFVLTGMVNGVTSCWTSRDGLAWSEAIPTKLDFEMAPIAFANGDLFAFSGSLVVSSDTAATWNIVSLSIGGTPVRVDRLLYAAGLYVAAGQDGYVASSPDFVTWTVRTQAQGDGIFYGAIHAHGYFILLTHSAILSSPDGFTWTETSVPEAENLDSVAFDGTKFVVVGSPGLTVDGTIS